MAVSRTEKNTFNNISLAISCLSYVLHLGKERHWFKRERTRRRRVRKTSLEREHFFGWTKCYSWIRLDLGREIFRYQADFALYHFLVSHVFCRVSLQPFRYNNPSFFKLLVQSAGSLPVLHCVLSSWKVPRKVPYLPALLHLLKSGPLCAS